MPPSGARPAEIRHYRPEDAVALFVIRAVLEPVDDGEMLASTQQLEERLETGTRAWVVAAGRALQGYAMVDPVPGLPGLADLSGGVLPAQRRLGIGGRLLEHVAGAAADAGFTELSCRVENLESETAGFLLRRGFAVEHEECLITMPAEELPPVPDTPVADFVMLPQDRAVPEFVRLYNLSFAGYPWSQPYAEAEVAALLGAPDDLLFLSRDGELIGVSWSEMIDETRGRVEPMGILPGLQDHGHGRRLMLATLHRLRARGAQTLEIGIWRNNDRARHLFESLGFREVANWYYLARDLRAGGVNTR